MKTYVTVYTKNSHEPFNYDDVEWISDTRKTLEIIQEKEYCTITNVFFKSELDHYTIAEHR